MKKGKQRWLQICNRLMSGILVLLGFTACSNVMNGDEPCMYGQPHADYEIKGKVQDAESKQPVTNARIIVKELDQNNKPWHSYPDTLTTGKTNEYIYKNTSTGYGRFRVICEDPSGVYKADSTDVEMHLTGGEGWYQGSDSKEVNFKLKKTEE